MHTLAKHEEQRVIDETHRYIRRATDIFGIRATPLEISFDLKGRAAGMYRVRKNLFQQKREIRYNPAIFARYFEDNLENTVPHEVAHLVCDLLYGLNRIKPHGDEWKQVMSAFGADARVTASYDLKDIPIRKLKMYPYRCSCGEQLLSSIRHNRVQRQRYRYYCRSCKQVLTPAS